MTTTISSLQERAVLARAYADIARDLIDDPTQGTVGRDALDGLRDLGRRIAGTPSHASGTCPDCGLVVRQCCDSTIGSPHLRQCSEFGDVPDPRRLRGDSDHAL